MKRIIIYTVVLAVIGLILGYLIFGRISGEYIEIRAIFTSSDNVLESIGRSITGLKEIKQNILISGGVGAIVGLVIALVRK
ncbi:MAG: hypothetical protein P1P82_05605 [Bacteroidales bacterium]|nr:hypothetical protein [Bacteroidales bacterium]MDT8431391.1 hypothetical protein [Bacteroidales bacterium]